MARRSRDRPVEKTDRDAESIPHDQLFKTLFDHFFIELIELFDPKLASELDPGSLQSLDKEFYSSFPRGERRQMDMVKRARRRSGDPELILIHVGLEGQYRSIHPDRMVEYYFGVKLKYPSLPVLPIALYLKGGPRRIDRREWVETVGQLTICRFCYHALGLSGSLAEQYLDRENPVVYALASLMRSERWDRPALKLECLRRIVGLELDEARVFLLANIVETYLELSTEEQRRYDQRLETEATNEEVKTMQMTWADKMIAKGREEGIARGREEGIARGRVEGARRTLVEVLAARFGPVSERVSAELDAIGDPEALRRLTRKALEVTSLEALGLGVSGLSKG